MSEPSTPLVVEPLWDLPPDSPLKVEWDLFCRERPRLLAEGHEGRWVLIKGEAIFGVFATRDEARNAGLQRFGVVSMLIQQILRCYRHLRQGYAASPGGRG
jgi:hypothetical protein